MHTAIYFNQSQKSISLWVSWLIGFVVKDEKICVILCFLDIIVSLEILLRCFSFRH